MAQTKEDPVAPAAHPVAPADPVAPAALNATAPASHVPSDPALAPQTALVADVGVALAPATSDGMSMIYLVFFLAIFGAIGFFGFKEFKKRRDAAGEGEQIEEKE